MSIPRVETPRPKPFFFQPPLTFSTKKERGYTPKDSAPPRPPIKSAPPVSRIFPRKQLVKALPVTFKSPDKPILCNRIYNEGKKELYFDQCFDIECKLGVGSFGEVFKVRSKEDGQLYAVKRSRQRFRGESDRHRRFEEVVKHETLPAHPNCVRFVKAWEEKQYLYIQTELCKTSLNVFAEENHDIPERLIWNYLVDLLMAVKHLHDHDLVHMDIKPENIFISNTNNVCKLGDFGLVIDLTRDVEISEAQEGDPKYLAPELMFNRFGKPADVFSLGITILELASDLDLPRGGDLWHKLRSGQLPEEFLIGISTELKEIIRWMMEPDPTKRPTVNEVLTHKHVIKTWHERSAEQIDTMPELSDGVETSSKYATSIKNVELSIKRPPDWGQSLFSDDDMPVDQAEGGSNHHGDLGIHGLARFHHDDHATSSSGAYNGLIGIPLDLSTSSSESDDSFRLALTREVKAATTPSYRRRRNNKVPPGCSSGSGSPIFTSSSSTGLFTSSPVGELSSSVHKTCRTTPSRRHAPTTSPSVSSGAQTRSRTRSTRSGGEPRWEESRARDAENREVDASGRGCDAEGHTSGEVRFNPVEPKNLLKAFETALAEDAGN